MVSGARPGRWLKGAPVFRRTRASALMRRGVPAGRGGVIPVYREWSWWTTVQFCPVEPEIEGNQPLQDGSSEHFGSRAASSPLGQCQLWNRTVVQRGERVVLDSASYEIGQSVQWAWIGPGGMVGRCREVLPGGIRATGGDGFCGLADLVPEGRRRRCVPLPSRGAGKVRRRARGPRSRRHRRAGRRRRGRGRAPWP